MVSLFMAEDETMTMQVTNPESQTIEVTSKGIVRMFASHLHAKEEGKEEPAGSDFPPSNSSMISASWLSTLCSM